MSDSALVDIKRLKVSFKTDDGWVDAITQMDLQLHRGRFTALVGESGSGKSVTARALMQLLPPNAKLDAASEIHYQTQRIDQTPEREMRKLRGNQIAMIFQEPMSSLNPLYTIGNQIAEMILQHQNVSKKQALEQALALLHEVQIPDPEYRLTQYPHQLSGGQRQRVMIAMALANRPDLLIADEPTTALDVTVQAQILDLLKTLQAERGMTVLLITHDLTLVRAYSDDVYVMHKGVLKEYGQTAELFANPQDAYTQHLLASEPTALPPPLPDQVTPLLEAKRVKVAFGMEKGSWFKKVRSELIAVNHLDLTLSRGETLGLVGESGSGKTTFGHAILRLLDCEADAIKFDGMDLSKLNRMQMRPLRRRAQIVFQDPFSSLNPRMNIRNIIEEGLVSTGLGDSASERFDRAEQALIDAGLDGNAMNRFPHEFSGGQRQRIAIARAIALEPEFIVLDEPTSALDLSVQAQIIELLLSLQRERNLSYLFISHDLRVVRALCHRVMVMNHGNLIEAGPTLQILETPQHEYTKRLVDAAFHAEQP